MRCPSCNDKGYIEGYVGVSASFTPSLEQCPERCNIGGYSKEVQRRLNNPNHVTERPVLNGKDSNPTPELPSATATVIPFPFKPRIV